jgi:ParB family chromosome partitioning protein
MAKRKRLSPDILTGSPPSPLRAPIAQVAREAASLAAAEELAQELSSARDEGRMVIRVPLQAVQIDHLVRDRITVEDDEMAALKASLMARGQQTPVELEALAEGRFGLISGWRRMKALAALAEETGEDRFATVLGLVKKPAERADAYLAMVEENEIRVGLSYVERARIVAKSVDLGVFETDRGALQALFSAASRAKRSKIGGFLPVVRHVGEALAFPTALGERLGLALGRALEADPGLGARVAAALNQARPQTAADEAMVLERALTPPATAPDPSRRPDALDAAVPAAKPQAIAKDPTAVPRPVSVRTAVMLSEDAEGRLILSGNRVDADLRARLIDWLRAR